MIYLKALTIATEWKNKLSPFCDRIEIAGSIRRKKEYVKDIELVCIPKILEQETLFGSAPASRCREFIELLSGIHDDNVMPLIGDPVKGKMVRVKLLEENIQMEIFTATPDNWGHILAIRTGPAGFTHHVLATTWRGMGYHSDDGFLRKGDKIIPVREEEDLFNLLDIDFVRPENRQWE